MRSDTQGCTFFPCGSLGLATEATSLYKWDCYLTVIQRGGFQEDNHSNCFKEPPQVHFQLHGDAKIVHSRKWPLLGRVSPLHMCVFMYYSVCFLLADTVPQHTHTKMLSVSILKQSRFNIFSDSTHITYV